MINYEITNCTICEHTWANVLYLSHSFTKKNEKEPTIVAFHDVNEILSRH